MQSNWPRIPARGLPEEMCGIAGIVHRHEQMSREALVPMAEALRHRGPDDHGFLVDGRVGLAHRRLSVIDTSRAARQPLFNEDQTVAVVANGEIYNFQELRRRLQENGHQFRSNSDSEVIVHAWEEYGEDCVWHLSGMFAFALFDRRRQKLFLARDRLGKKPLYYLSHGSSFSFASEIKALYSQPHFSAEIDVEALGEYAAYGFALGERSVLRGVRRLLPAHHLTLDLGKLEWDPPKIERYWDVKVCPDEETSEEEWLERLDQALSKAVQRRLMSDVPLGAFLSGGIDSSLVVAYMARLSEHPVKTFTMGFGESSHDESGFARAVADHLGTEHHEQRVVPDAVTILDRLIDIYDEPFADESAVPTLLLSGMARQKVTVALSGDGGDEGFLGYRRYPFSSIGHTTSRLVTPVGRSLLKLTGERLPRSAWARRYFERFSLSGFDHYHHAMGYCDEFLGILHPEIKQQLASVWRGKMEQDFENCPQAPMVERFGQVDLRNYLPDDVLVKVDRASMHHALEVRWSHSWIMK